MKKKHLLATATHECQDRPQEWPRQTWRWIFFRNSIIAGKEHALLFFIDFSINDIESVRIMHADTTIKVVSHFFYQLLTIHCAFSDALMPAFYVVMISNCRTLYDAVFLQKRKHLPVFKSEKYVDILKQHCFLLYNSFLNVKCKVVTFTIPSICGCIKRMNSEVECFWWRLERKIQVRGHYSWVFLYRLKIIAHSYAIEISHL